MDSPLRKRRYPPTRQNLPARRDHFLHPGVEAAVRSKLAAAHRLSVSARAADAKVTPRRHRPIAGNLPPRVLPCLSPPDGRTFAGRFAGARPKTRLKPRQAASLRHRSENALVRFENVGLRYGLGPEVVRDLNFSIAPQSFQFLTGPSGAGKTTLLRLMLLSLRPTRGTIHILGHDARALTKDDLTALRRRIGVVFQDFRLLDHLTTYENVALPLRAMGRAESRLPRRGHRALAMGRPGRPHERVAAGSVGRRKTTRRHRPRA